MLRFRPIRNLYLHFPLCKHHCSYCDFNVLSLAEAKSKWPSGYMNIWVDKILEQARAWVGTQSRLPLETLYIGGGTPSLLPLKDLERLIAGLRECFEFQASIEFTLEANPENITTEYLRNIKSLGINRLSVGIQSSLSHQLRRLERLATAEVVERVCGELKSEFNNFNLDFMMGIPEQNLESLETDLEFILNSAAPHVSVYLLTIAEDHKYFKSKILKSRMADPELATEMYLKVYSRLESRGFKHYEVSNAALPGFESRHNQNYWNVSSSYLGLGPGAHGYLTLEDHEQKKVRYESIRDLRAWVDSKEFMSSPEFLTLEQQRLERLYLALRTRHPVSLSELDAEASQSFLSQGWASIDESKGLVLTQKAWPLIESLAARLIP